MLKVIIDLSGPFGGFRYNVGLEQFICFLHVTVEPPPFLV